MIKKTDYGGTPTYSLLKIGLSIILSMISKHEDILERRPRYFERRPRYFSSWSQRTASEERPTSPEDKLDLGCRQHSPDDHHLGQPKDNLHGRTASVVGFNVKNIQEAISGLFIVYFWSFTTNNLTTK